MTPALLTHDRAHVERCTVSSSNAPAPHLPLQLTAAYARAAAQGFQGDQPAGKWAPMAQDKVVALAK